MSITEEARAEAERRYPAWIHRVLHYAGYWAFIAGAQWQAARNVQAAPTDRERLDSIYALLSSLDLDGQMTREGTAWGSILREAKELSRSQPVQVEVTTASFDPFAELDALRDRLQDEIRSDRLVPRAAFKRLMADLVALGGGEHE